MKSRKNSIKFLSLFTLLIFFINILSCDKEPVKPPPGFNCEEINNTIQFANRTWFVRNSSTRENPGKNYFSNSKCNVWIDENKDLHLRITNRNGKWECAEVYTQSLFDYGQYEFYISSRVDQLDQNIVLGLFTYDNTTCLTDANSEIDIEFCKWGNGLDINNSQYSVQPGNNNYDPFVKYDERFNRYWTSLSGNYSTHVFNWTPTIVNFNSYHGHTISSNNTIYSWSFDSNNPGRKRMCKPDENNQSTWQWSDDIIIPKPSSSTFVDINLWLNDTGNDGGDPPSDGKEYEIVIHDFKYTPLNQQYLINEDFESYQVNTFPSSGGWILKWNGAGDSYQKVINTDHVSGSQSMQLLGKNWWAVCMYKPITQNPNVIYAEGWVKASNKLTGQEDDRCEIAFQNLEQGSWGTCYAAIGLFGKTGKIYCWMGSSIWKEISDYDVNKWYKLRIKYSLLNHSLSAWVDDILVLDNYTESQPNNGYTSITLEACHGNTTYYFDDLKVWTE